MEITAATTAAELFDHYPESVKVFVDLRLGCVGCPTEKFHSLQDIAQNNNLSLEELTERLQATVGLNIKR